MQGVVLQVGYNRSLPYFYRRIIHSHLKFLILLENLVQLNEGITVTSVSHASAVP